MKDVIERGKRALDDAKKSAGERPQIRTGVWE